MQQFAPHVGVRHSEGWTTTADLAGPRLADALNICGASLDTDRPDIRGQRLVEVVTWLLALPAAAALVQDTDPPNLDADNVLLWIGDEPPEGTGIAITDPRPRPKADLEAIRELLAREHLAPLIDAVNDATQRPRSALWRSADDRLAAAVAWVAELTSNRERAFALLDGKAELRMFDAGSYETMLHVREGCCLYYRTPADVKCFSCPLLDDDARRRLVAGGA